MLLPKFENHSFKYEYVNEIFFLCLFLSVTSVNKFVLSELRFTVPTVFQGWQTLSCVILLSALIRFKKIKNDIQILDAKVLSLLTPALICFTLSIVAGSKALADMNVPVFLAITNLYPAILVFVDRKTELGNASLKVCGSAAILGTITIILIFIANPINAPPILWLMVHIFLNIVYFVYLNKLNLDLTHTTQIYYRNFFSVMFLFPVSFFLDVLHLPRNGGWEFYGGCFLSGILGTLLQIWTFKISIKPNFLLFEGLAKLLCSLLAYKLFFANIEPFIWVLIIINFSMGMLFLKSSEKECVNIKSKINLSIPPPDEFLSEADVPLLV